MKTVTESLVEFLEANDLNYTALPGQSAFHLCIHTENADYGCVAVVLEREQEVVVYSVCPVRVPQEKRAIVAEFITRLNYGMRLGSFDMDFDDGEIRCRSALGVRGNGLTEPLLAHLFRANIRTMDRLLPNLLAVIYGRRIPQKEIEWIKTETDQHEENTPSRFSRN